MEKNNHDAFVFTIPGKPQSKERARVCCDPRTGRVHSYTPERTAVYEALVRQYYKISHGPYYGKDALAVEIAAFYAIPKSYSKKKTAEICGKCLRPTVKPDCDNIIKSILDALNGLAYSDDSQIASVTCGKYYAMSGEDARVTVKIERIGILEEGDDA